MEEAPCLQPSSFLCKRMQISVCKGGVQSWTKYHIPVGPATQETEVDGLCEQGLEATSSIVRGNLQGVEYHM